MGLAAIATVARLAAVVTWAFVLAAVPGTPAPVEGASPATESSSGLPPLLVEEAFPSLSFSQMVHITDAADSTGRL